MRIRHEGRRRSKLSLSPIHAWYIDSYADEGLPTHSDRTVYRANQHSERERLFLYFHRLIHFLFGYWREEERKKIGRQHIYTKSCRVYIEVI